MGVRDAAHFGKRLVELDVRGRIRRRAEIPLHHFAVQIDDDHVARLHAVVLDARGLDDDEPRLSIDGGDVPPRKEHEFVLYEV